MSDYKTFKEASVSGLTGSTISHVNMISFVALASIALYSTLQTRVYRVRAIPFLVSWIVLLLPLLLSMTLFANKPLLLSFLLLVPTGLILLRTPHPSSAIMPMPAHGRSPSPLPGVDPSRLSEEVKPGSLRPLPALTTYRAHMMLMTILGILAVDFPVFPRALAKCESYGRLVDGSRRGLLRVLQRRSFRHTAAQGPDSPQCATASQSERGGTEDAPIIALGAVRVLLVKGTEYPEHETEYGTHWNFFITLALLPVLQVLLHPLIRVVPASLLGVGVGILQQLALSIFGLKHYVRTAPA